MRVAWIGPTPSEGGGGGPEAAVQMLLALAEAGADVELFLPARLDELPTPLRDHPSIHVHAHPVRWEWDRWYSSKPIVAHLSGMLARARNAGRIATAVVRLHEDDPLDVVYQFSQPELLGLRRHRAALPPVVAHPGVHAMGELRWLWRERALSAQAGESQRRRRFLELLLALRAVVQRRDLRAASGVIGISETFADLLARDYGLDRRAIPAVHYPIDLDRFSPPERPSETPRPIRLVVVTGICVRKGVELVVELSRRLDDLAGVIEIVIAGSHRSWSDYRPLLDDLNPRIATYRGGLERDELVDLLHDADGLLQPAPYEPMGLALAEALGCGLPVVASDAVGAAEALHPDCTLRFAAGDAGAFELAVRTLIADSAGKPAARRRALARAEAERLFSRASVGPRLVRTLSSFAAAGRTEARR